GSALHGPASDVADAEDSLPAGFEKQRRRVTLTEIGLRDVRAGEQESVLVLCELPVEPLGARRRTDEDEERTNSERCGLLTLVVVQNHPLQLSLADETDHLRAMRNADMRMTLDLVDQVPRHRGRE